MHRDLRLDNIILGNDGYLKIIEYENAKFLPNNQKSRKILGNVEYLAPEVI